MVIPAVLGSGGVPGGPGEGEGIGGELGLTTLQGQGGGLANGPDASPSDTPELQPVTMFASVWFGLFYDPVFWQSVFLCCCCYVCHG